MIESNVLFSSALLRIEDVSCRSPRSACGREESTLSHEVVLTRRGVFVKHAGRQTIVAEPTHVLFFNRGESYRTSHPNHGGDDCTAISLSADAVTEIVSVYDAAAQDREGRPFILTHGLLPANAMWRHQLLRQDIRSGVVDALRTEETAMDIVYACVRDAFRSRGVHPVRARAETQQSRRDLCERVRILLASNPAHATSLSALAKAVYSSPFHLARVFRETIGIPIHQYHLRLRLAAALDRLTTDCAGLTALAIELGFSSHSHFTSSFRRTFGMSPSAFQRRASSVYRVAINA